MVLMAAEPLIQLRWLVELFRFAGWLIPGKRGLNRPSAA
jgi:hypothetical protein